jgi:hypothetical protein
MGTAIKGNKCLSADFEGHSHDRSRLPSVNLVSGLGIAADGTNFRILEDRNIELRRLLRLSIKPQARADLRCRDLQRFTPSDTLKFQRARHGHVMARHTPSRHNTAGAGGGASPTGKRRQMLGQAAVLAAGNGSRQAGSSLSRAYQRCPTTERGRRWCLPRSEIRSTTRRARNGRPVRLLWSARNRCSHG